MSLCLLLLCPVLICKQSAKRQWMKIIIVLKKGELDCLIKRVRDYNQDLFVLFGLKTMSIAANNPQPSRRGTKFYEKVRQHMEDLDDMLCRKYLASSSCKCSNPHDANLKLEYRKPQKTGARLKFEIVFAVDSNFGSLSNTSLPWKWRETELEPHNIEPPEDEDSTQAQPSSSTTQAPRDKPHPAPPPPIPNSTLRPALMQIEPIPKPPKSGKFDRLKSKIKTPSEIFAKGLRVSFSPVAAKTPSVVITPAPISAQTSTFVTASTSAPRSLQSPHKTRVAFNIASSSQPSRFNLQEIADLCSALSRPDFGVSWCGLLTHEQMRCQRISAVMKLGLSADSEIKTISLASLLSNRATDLKQQKWALGLQLASSVLQLHTTHWLNERWGAKDILFFQQGNGSIFYDSPFIRRTYAASPSASMSSISLSKRYRSVPSLFALGIVMIELYYRRPFEELQNDNEKQTSMKVSVFLMTII
jgi:hypothetical protein